MKIYPLLVNGKKNYQDKDSLESLNSLNSLNSIIGYVKEGQDYLHQIGIDDIISCLTKLTQEWSDRKSFLQTKYQYLGINYLIYFFKKTNLENISNLSLRGNRHVMDNYTSIPVYPNKLLAQPRGIICHWLSGNIPILGIISIVQGLLTKNANIIKISKATKFLISDLLYSLNKIKTRNSKGQIIYGKKILSSIAVIYVERDDEAQKQLSEVANVRVAWGGKEAVAKVINLPHHYTCENVILGPRTSFAVIGKEYLQNKQQAQEIAKKIAHDTALYEQKGCNSPHTVFVEKSGKISPQGFAQILAEQLEKISKSYPLKQIDPIDAQRIILQRTKYDMIGLAYYPSNLQWTVLYGENEKGIATPCFNRTLFVKPANNVFEVEQYCSSLTQSAGTALSQKRKEKFARLVTNKGVDRCPDIGNMIFYDTPWDGMFIMDRFVRWSKI